MRQCRSSVNGYSVLGQSSRRWLPYLILALHASVSAAAAQFTIQVKDYAAMPITGVPAGKSVNAPYLSRVNFLREEPGVNRHRLFVNDLNGPLYIIDKKAKTFTT